MLEVAERVTPDQFNALTTELRRLGRTSTDRAGCVLRTSGRSEQEGAGWQQLAAPGGPRIEDSLLCR